MSTLADNIDPEYLEPHYSTKLWRAMYHYCSHFYSKQLFAQICQEMKMPEEYVLADDNWVSNKFIAEFSDRLKKHTNDPNVFRSVGSFTIDRENINPLEYALIKSMPPIVFFRATTLTYSKFNLVNDVKALKMRPGHFIFTTKPRGKVVPHADVCLNTLGVIDGTKQVFDLDSLDVQETSCIHRGATHCTFDIKYKAKRYWLKKLLGFVGIPITAYLTIPSVLKIGSHNVELALRTFHLLFFFSAAGFLIYLKKFEDLVKYNRYYFEQNKQKQMSLHSSRVRLDRRLRESRLLSKISSSLISSASPNDVVKACLNELEAKFGYERSMVMLLSADQSRLYTADIRGFSEQTDSIYKLAFAYPGEIEKPGIFANILKLGKAVLVSDIEKYKQTLKPENQRLIEQFQVNSLVVCPLQDSTDKYGLMIVGSVATERKLNSEDLHLVEEIGRLFSISFQNARNYEREQVLRTTFQKYVPKAVVESVYALRSQGSSISPRTMNITSMFIDLRGFTTMSEKLDPEKVMNLLNLYISFISKHISLRGGVVDNLLGDGVVVFFPEGDTELKHEERAVLSALDILCDLEKLKAEFRSRGYGVPSLGIGLHSGVATVGNLGSDIKMNYTAVGDTVNLAARFQDLTKRYSGANQEEAFGCAILSNATYKLLEQSKVVGKGLSHFKNLGQLSIRGRNQSELGYLVDQNLALQISQTLIIGKAS